MTRAMGRETMETTRARAMEKKRENGSSKKKDFHTKDKSTSMESFAPPPISYGYGHRRTQIVGVLAKFSIDATDFHDWKRPQSIYGKELICEQEEHT